MWGGGWLVYHNNTFSATINILELSVNMRGAEEIVSVLSGRTFHLYICLLHLAGGLSQTHPDHDHYRAQTNGGFLTIWPRPSSTSRR